MFVITRNVFNDYEGTETTPIVCCESLERAMSTADEWNQWIEENKPCSANDWKFTTPPFDTGARDGDDLSYRVSDDLPVLSATPENATIDERQH